MDGLSGYHTEVGAAYNGIEGDYCWGCRGRSEGVIDCLAEGYAEIEARCILYNIIIPLLRCHETWEGRKTSLSVDGVGRYQIPENILIEYAACFFN